jgi:endonuclease/exonuclease/phosphatase family metal-dependent hydrolase
MRSLLAAALVACGAACGAPESTQAEDATEAWSPDPVREGNLRIATYNIRNFPSVQLLDPDAAQSPPPLSFLRDTDREAVISLLGRLSFDVLAVQEILDVEAFVALLEDLGAAEGKEYAWTFAENAAGNPQRVGLVVDSAKVKIEDVREHVEVDVSGTLRPGLSARIVSQRDGGIDFSVMVLHLASGDSGGRVQLRAKQAGQAAKIISAQQLERMDDDYLVMGDLNTAREEQEYPGLDGAFAEGTSLTRQENENGCTAYWIKNSNSPLVRPSWIDHVYRSSLAERDEQVSLVSGAHCAEHVCATFESRDAQSGGSFYSVSDHCPVYFELRDADED